MTNSSLKQDVTEGECMHCYEYTTMYKSEDEAEVAEIPACQIPNRIKLEKGQTFTLQENKNLDPRDLM